MFSATCILYSTSVTAMVASGFHEVRWTLLFIICLTQLMTQSRVVPRVGTVTLALWLTSTIAATCSLTHIQSTKRQLPANHSLFTFIWILLESLWLCRNISRNIPEWNSSIFPICNQLMWYQCTQNTFIQPSNEILAKTIHCQFAF